MLASIACSSSSNLSKSGYHLLIFVDDSKMVHEDDAPFLSESESIIESTTAKKSIKSWENILSLFSCCCCCLIPFWERPHLRGFQLSLYFNWSTVVNDLVDLILGYLSNHIFPSANKNNQTSPPSSILTPCQKSATAVFGLRKPPAALTH